MLNSTTQYLKTAEIERGFSLLEVLVSAALLAMVGVTFPAALDMGIRASNQIDVRTTAQSLAGGQMETIKAGAYAVAQGGTGNYTSMLSAIPAGFRFDTMDSNNNIVTDSVYGIPWDVAGNAQWTKTKPSDPGIQKVTIIVNSKNELSSGGVYKEIFRLTDFKVNR
jgi:prepilin-type N-terminal cleavage/methylation domain-containing protein